MQNMKNKITFQLWKNPIIVCREFVHFTNIMKYVGEGNNLTPFLSSVISESVDIFEMNCSRLSIHPHERLYDIKSFIINDECVQKYIYNIILFFSRCYENDPTLLSYAFGEILQTTVITTTERIISMWCFFIIKEKLLIENRMICITEPVFKFGILVYDIMNYEEIVHRISTEFNYMFNIGWGLHMIEYGLIFSRDGTKYFYELQEIINKCHYKNTFVYKLEKYNQFTYFVNIDSNPQLGKLTYLRFL